MRFKSAKCLKEQIIKSTKSKFEGGLWKQVCFIWVSEGYRKWPCLWDSRFWGSSEDRSFFVPVGIISFHFRLPSTWPSQQARVTVPAVQKYYWENTSLSLRRLPVLGPIYFSFPHSSLGSKRPQEHTSHFLYEGSADTRGPCYCCLPRHSDDNREYPRPSLHQSLEWYQSLNLPQQEFLTNRGIV